MKAMRLRMRGGKLLGSRVLELPAFPAARVARALGRVPRKRRRAASRDCA